MDLPELLQIGEKERAAQKPVRIRCCVAAGCLSAGSDAVRANLVEGVKQAGLDDRVQVSGVGCMRLCSRGPLVQIDPEGALFEKSRRHRPGTRRRTYRRTRRCPARRS